MRLSACDSLMPYRGSRNRCRVSSIIWLAPTYLRVPQGCTSVGESRGRGFVLADGQQRTWQAGFAGHRKDASERQCTRAHAHAVPSLLRAHEVPGSHAQRRDDAAKEEDQQDEGGRLLVLGEEPLGQSHGHCKGARGWACWACKSAKDAADRCQPGGRI